MIDLIQLHADNAEFHKQLRSIRELAREAQEHLVEAKAETVRMTKWAEGQIRIAEGLRGRA